MYESTPTDTPGLDEYLRALRSRWWVVALAVLVGLAASFAYTKSRTEQYQATATVSLGSTPVGGSIQQPAQPDPGAEAERVKSTPVAQAAVKAANSSISADDALGHVSVSFVQNRPVLDVQYKSTDPNEAKTMANAFASAYAAQRQQAATSFYDSQDKLLKDQLTGVNASLADVQTQLNSVRDRLDQLGQGAQTAAVQNEKTQRNAELAQLQTQQLTLLSQQARLTDDISTLARARDNQAKSAEVIREAGVPTAPVGVSNTVVHLGGVLLGLIAGLLVAFTLARLDQSATDQEEVEEAIGAPALASVPPFRLTRATGVNALVMISNGRSLRLQRARESYRRLRTSTQLLVAKSGRNSIALTSAHPGEGKSVTAANLAIANAQAGKRTVLVSADLRRPSIERLLSVPNDKGLSDWLAEETEAVVQELPTIPNLSVVVAGNQLEGPGELLASPRLDALIQDLEAEYDLVVLDTPPVLAIADAATIAHSVGGIVLVVDGRRSDLEVLHLVTAELQRAGGNVVGAVMNRSHNQPGRLLLRREAYAYEREARRRLD